jgi:hypothetical protein
MDRGPAYWPARIMLGVGIVATLLAIVLAVVVVVSWPTSVSSDPSMGPLVAAGVASVGLVWMVRIFRGPGDDPPAWRHHDRR